LFTFKETKEPCTKKQNETQEPLPNIKEKKETQENNEEIENKITTYIN
jgi:hypothetical protein